VPQIAQGSAPKLQAGLPEHSQLPWPEMNAQSQAGSVTLPLGHTVLHVRPRKLLAAPDTDGSVSSTAQHKIQKNVALRTRHHVSWYVNAHAQTGGCEIHHQILLMRFPQKIITSDRQVKPKIKILKVIISFQIMLENTKYD